MSDERRRIIGGWLGGPRSVSPLVLGFPGERLGFPEKGPGSVAPMGLRLAALIVVCGLLLPVLGISLLLIGAVEWGVLRRWPSARQWLGMAPT